MQFQTIHTSEKKDTKFAGNISFDSDKQFFFVLHKICTEIIAHKSIKINETNNTIPLGLSANEKTKRNIILYMSFWLLSVLFIFFADHFCQHYYQHVALCVYKCLATEEIHLNWKKDPRVTMNCEGNENGNFTKCAINNNQIRNRASLWFESGRQAVQAMEKMNI